MQVNLNVLHAIHFSIKTKKTQITPTEFNELILAACKVLESQLALIIKAKLNAMFSTL